MKNHETIFNPIFRFIGMVNKLISRIEYHYEINLKQIVEQPGNQFHLKFQTISFFKGYFTEIYRNISGNKVKRMVFPKYPVNKKKPKIVHLILRIGTVGGAAKLIFDIVRGLGNIFAMEVVILSDLNLESYPNLKLHCFSNHIDTITYLKKLNPDIIHAHYYGDWGGFHEQFEALLKTNLRAKIILNLLVPIHIYRSNRIDEYVFISEYVRDIQHKHYKNERIIYFGVDTDEFKPVEQAHHDSIGMIYRLFNDKIDESTIELFIKLVKERPQTKVYIVGDGQNFHYYVERTRHEGVRNNFIFTGTIDYSEVPDYYDKFDIFVAPIHTESYGIVVPNAMAKNLPIVAYRRGVLPELLGKTNVLVNTEREMIDELKHLLDHPEKAKRLASGGRRRVMEKLSREKMLADYKDLYFDLLKRKSRR